MTDANIWIDRAIAKLRDGDAQGAIRMLNEAKAEHSLVAGILNKSLEAK